MKFGIIGPGKIAHRFAVACSRVEGVTLAAAASTSRERAKKFADTFGAEKAYGSYEELIADKEIDAVYIAVINTLHYETAKRCLMAGKAVLCEKPMCLSVEETESLFRIARENHVLLMEGMWTVFLPCIRQAKQWVMDGRIGTVKYMESKFSFYNAFDAQSRLFAKELGGGGALDVGIYCLAFSLFMSDSKLQSCQSACYTGSTGVDEMGSAILQFADGAVANCTFGIQGTLGDTGLLCGDQGSIRLPRFWGCRRAEMCDASGHVTESVEDSQDEGFVYELEAFARAFEEGKTEVHPASHELTLECARLLEQIRRNG